MADDSTEAQRLEREIFHWEQQDPDLLYNVIKPGGVGANNKGRIHSPEWNHKNGMAQPSRVEIKETKLETGRKDLYISITAAAKGIPCALSNVQYALKHGTQIRGIYKIERVNK